jgi:hypothetical protein
LKNRAMPATDGRDLEPRPDHDHALEAAETLARWMDQRFLDPLLGLLLPGVGDLIGSALGIYPVALAWRRGAPKALLARMLLNLAVDALGGSVPVLGDVWDFLFRAHSRNLALLRARSVGPQVHGRLADGLIVGVALGVALLAFVAALAVPVLVVIALVRAVTGG